MVEGRVSKLRPIQLIKGRPINTDEDPVKAKTIKIRMSSHICLTTHLFSNLFITKTDNLIITIDEIRVVITNKIKCSLSKSLYAILYPEKNDNNTPVSGAINCQLLSICHLALKSFMSFELW